MLLVVSISTITRSGQSETFEITFLDQTPVELRTSSMISGCDDDELDVLVAAKTRPLPSVCKDLRLMWSSALFGPLIACSSGCHVVSGAPSLCTAKNIA